MKSYLLGVSLFYFSVASFSQNKSLFSKENNSFDYTIKKNDSSLLHKQLFDNNTLPKNSFLLPGYEQISKRKTFLESENSATKDVMPIFKPKGNYKQRSIFPDNSMNHFLLIQPVKER